MLPRRGVSSHATAAEGFAPELEPPPQLISSRDESNEIVKIFMIYCAIAAADGMLVILFEELFDWMRYIAPAPLELSV